MKERTISSIECPTSIAGLTGAAFFDLHSSHVDDSFRIFVAEPADPQPDTRYPVLYVLDANGMFGMARDIAGLLAMATEVPPMYVVGIGYAVESGFAETLGIRCRDLCPTPGSALEAQMVSSFDPSGRYAPGGGPNFLRFLVDELKPALQQAYAIDPGDATIAGASLGGLFTTWTLLHHPDSFQKYLSISPSLFWERERVWDWVEAFAAEHDDVKATLFVSAGGLETAEETARVMRRLIQMNDDPFPGVNQQAASLYEAHGWPRCAEITQVLADRLNALNLPQLEAVCHNFPDETHVSVPASAIARGLRYFSGHWQPE